MTSEKTELQREILLTWYENPVATKKEISEHVGCSASYVSTVTNRFDNYDEMEAMIDRQDREIEQMFGDGFFEGNAVNWPETASSPATEQGLADTYENLPDNTAGNLLRALILLVLLYVIYEVALVLFL